MEHTVAVSANNCKIDKSRLPNTRKLCKRNGVVAFNEAGTKNTVPCAEIKTTCFAGKTSEFFKNLLLLSRDSLWIPLSMKMTSGQ